MPYLSPSTLQHTHEEVSNFFTNFPLVDLFILSRIHRSILFNRLTVDPPTPLLIDLRSVSSRSDSPRCLSYRALESRVLETFSNIFTNFHLVDLSQLLSNFTNFCFKQPISALASMKWSVNHSSTILISIQITSTVQIDWSPTSIFHPFPSSSIETFSQLSPNLDSPRPYSTADRPLIEEFEKVCD